MNKQAKKKSISRESMPMQYYDCIELLEAYISTPEPWELYFIDSLYNYLVKHCRRGNMPFRAYDYVDIAKRWARQCDKCLLPLLGVFLTKFGEFCRLRYERLPADVRKQYLAFGDPAKAGHFSKVVDPQDYFSKVVAKADNWRKLSEFTKSEYLKLKCNLYLGKYRPALANGKFKFWHQQTIDVVRKCRSCGKKLSASKLNANACGLCSDCRRIGL